MSKKDLDAVERGEKAMIVSRCTAYTPPVGLIIKDYDPVNCWTGWHITSGRNEGLIQWLGLLGDQFKQINIDVVQPGQYSLTSFIASKYDSWNGYADNYQASDLNGTATFYAGIVI